MSEQQQHDAPGGGWERTVRAARRAGPTWTVGRQQRLRWATMVRLDSPLSGRRRLLVGLTLAGCSAIAAVVFFGRARLPRSEAGASPAAVVSRSAATERSLPKLADGSSVVLDGPGAVLRKTAETPDEVAFQLDAGGAHFEVVRRPSRLFRVHAGLVTVQVIGTRFHVQRQQERARVAVDRGRVLVSWWGGSRELGVGDEGIFPPLDEMPIAAAGATSTTSNAAGAAPPPAGHGSSLVPATALARPVRSAPQPRSNLAQHPATDSSIASAGRASTLLGPELLFRRADRARAAGHPTEAVNELRQIVERFPRDPHAPMAAFTMGRLLLESLRRPAEAAQAFAHARALADGGTLGEDALAREVQALHEAGDTAGARRRAELYLRLFPAGPRAKMVSRFGELRPAP